MTRSEWLFRGGGMDWIRRRDCGGGFGGGVPGGAEGDVEGGGARWHGYFRDGFGGPGAEEPPCERGLGDVVAGVFEEAEADAAALLELTVLHMFHCAASCYGGGDSCAWNEDACDAA